MNRDDYSSLDDNDIPEVDLEAAGLDDGEVELDEDMLADLSDDEDEDEDY